MAKSSCEKTVTVALTVPYFNRLIEHAAGRNVEPSAAARAMLESALRGIDPELRDPHGPNHQAEYVLRELAANGKTFSGADFLKRPGCGQPGLENLVKIGWLAAESGETYRLTETGVKALGGRRA